MKILIVEEKFDEKKLSNFLLSKFNGLTNNTIYKALRKKDIRINNVKVNENVILHTGDEVKIFIVDELLFKFAPKSFEIIYEDDNIILVNKPINIEVTGENSLTSCIQKIYKEKGFKFVEPCHRLDRNTSGLILFAKNEGSLNELLNMFKENKIEKHYRAITYGIPRKKYEYLVAYLFKDTKKSLVYISNDRKKGYQEIKTSYNLISCDKKNNLALLDIQLHTGRTHQIRAHLAHIGYPILGDGKYGINKINKNFHLTTQMLCSYSITFHINSSYKKLRYLDGKTFCLNTLPFNLKEVNFNV